MIHGPKQLKHEKTKKGKLKHLDFKSLDLKFGTCGLKAIESGILTAKQIESARQAITRKIKKSGKVWVRVFPDLPITSNPTGVRMGKGKGSLSHWGARVKSGTILFEICGGGSSDTIYSAFRTGGAKLPIKTCQITHTFTFTNQLQ